MSENKPISNETAKRLKIYEVVGAIFVSLAAVLLHYLYDLSGQQFWTTPFSAINESIWEHMKIFTIPYVVWAFVELCCIRLPFKKFVAGKVLSLYFLLISIPLFYYTYTGLIGKNIAIVDIVCGFVFTVIAFIISYRLITKAPCIERYYKLSLFLIVAYVFMIAFFTYTPPRFELFRDPITGSYGLE